MKSDIEKLFNAHLTEKFSHKPEVLKYLLQNDRKQVCLDNLCEQIIRAERKLILFDLTRWKSMIRSTAEMFAGAALRKAEEAALSPAERSRRIKVAGRDKELDDIMADLKKEGSIRDRTIVRSTDGSTEVTEEGPEA